MNEILVIDRSETEQGISILACFPGAGFPHDGQVAIQIPYEAIVNRRSGYGLDDDESAITAILNEHATRIWRLPDDTHENPKIARMGGLRSDVTTRQVTLDELPTPTARPPRPLTEIEQLRKDIEELKAAKSKTPA